MESLRTEVSGVVAASRVSGIHVIPRKAPVWPRAVAFVAGASGVMAISAPLGGWDLRPTGPTSEAGSVSVAGQLTRNDCGVGLGVPDVWQNPGRVSKSGDVVHWEPADGSVPLSGKLDGRSSATMRSTLIVQMKPADVAASGCVMRRDDRLDLVLAAHSPTVVGDLTYTFSSLNQATCSNELAARGGTYDRLPCEVHYALTSKPEPADAPK
jgi:hypothetical protein